MTMRRWFVVLVGAALFVPGTQTVLGAGGKQAARFASLEAQAPEVARAQALAWLKGAAAGDAAKLQRAEAIWKQEDRTVLDRLADTFALGSADAARLLTAARNPLSAPPTEVPDGAPVAKPVVSKVEVMTYPHARKVISDPSNRNGVL